MRLDRYLSLSGERTRSESTRLIRGGCVTVNGISVRDPGMKLSENACVELMGKTVEDRSFQYYMLNKPAGILTAAEDSRCRTVMDLMPEALRRRDVLPVGRLDKDTTGLLLLTNDGALAHSLLHPSRHVWKQYTALVEGTLSTVHEQAFSEGIRLKDFTTLPAEMHILFSGPEKSRATVRVREGKFHQIRRMFAALGHEVLQLHRDSFGPLTLPADLPTGEYRELTPEEILTLKKAAGSAISTGCGGASENAE